jgi:hypothetical protein
MSSLAAAVQGVDEAVISGAQIVYPKQFGMGQATVSSLCDFFNLTESSPFS